ncbi:TlpA family protein disulfide reductase [Dyadobacter fermentans]|uniref:Alkyl hydroperoxide reductase/ Thiol specific antioxidant/ Mal allergen n=1 Tax=Dyadobacter fermentans (strain ATCC 700827 / DSM 18053 / CIP 107007 / KCTC 52180 / NS114) TaxID=471854 RepID=C6VUB9_DYAFD|nr:TlpA disulfide reductase family protein [Dyadobacter fermentans]ACT96601.1 alkyl hydroperoxide reductase/ Thiol specific antioxidant/ Mal allergen [Dyadobacter fermentans DSM 18053]
MKKSCMKLIVLFALTVLLIPNPSTAQQQQFDDTPIRNINTFYQFIDEKLNKDSAFFYLQKVAGHGLSASRIPGIIHEELAQYVLNRSFPPDMDSAIVARFRRGQVVNKQLMEMIMADTNKVLKGAVNPLYLFSKIQDNPNDNQKLAQIANQFIREELSDKDIYSNRSGRYALMIYPLLRSQKELQPLAATLLKKTSDYVNDGLLLVSENTTGDNAGKRAWYRYLYAYTNVLNSEQVNDPDKKMSLLKTAFDYSPDVLDRSNNWGYFYDMFIIFGKEKASFRDEYLQFLTEHVKDQQVVFNTILEIALQQPEYKGKLKEVFHKINGPQKDFAQFWMATVDHYAQPAPPISLSMLDKSRFSNQTAAGKWILIDFWGTWCGPCRSEHPAIQKFYESVVTANAGKIAMLTIACRDTEAKVTNYMKEKKFSFPVAMSDNQVEHTYKVPGYPTKLLITPAGKYITVPAGHDWASFVTHYADL